MVFKGAYGFKALRDSGFAVCGIGGVEKLTDDRSRDIDLLVLPQDLRNIVKCLLEAYRGNGWEFIKIIKNEYAWQLFFSIDKDQAVRFVQWDIMPRLTWRGLEVVDGRMVVKRCQEVEEIPVAKNSDVEVYKSFRGSLCGSAEAKRRLNDLENNRSFDSGPHSWLKGSSEKSISRLRSYVFRRRILSDLSSFVSFYVSNVRRLLNPPGLTVVSPSGEFPKWANLMERATAEEEAFPYTGIRCSSGGIPSLRGRLRLLKDLYLGKVIVFKELQPQFHERRFVPSRFRYLAFLLLGRPDAYVEADSETVPPHSALLRQLVAATRKTFVKNEVS